MVNWVFSFEIPDRHTFSGSVQKALDTGVVCSKARRDIIQILRTLVLQFTRYPKPDEYNTVSMKLVEKYPTLHDGDSENGYVSKGYVRGILDLYHYYLQGSWKLSLRNSFKNYRRDRVDDDDDTTSTPPSKRKRSTVVIDVIDDITDEDYEDALLKLQEEQKKRKKSRNHATIKELMEKTFPKRRKWIVEDCPLVYGILKKFPLLNSSKMVTISSLLKIVLSYLNMVLQIRREFRSVAGIDNTATSLLNYWPDWSHRIIEFSKAESTTRPAIAKLIAEYNTDVDVHNPAGMLLYSILLINMFSFM